MTMSADSKEGGDLSPFNDSPPTGIMKLPGLGRLVDDPSSDDSDQDEDEKGASMKVSCAADDRNCKQKAGSSVTFTSHSTRRKTFLVRLLLLDMPLFILLLLMASVNWVHHVHENYIDAQFEAMKWNEERQHKEITYYSRRCDENDLTTNNTADLVLPDNATVEQAYNHHYRHGFSIFRNVVSKEAAQALRNYAVERNRQLTYADRFHVLANDNRHCFALDVNSDPSVANALMELANHPLLTATLEKLVGPDAAIVELSVLTSTYGAKAQRWHDDIIPEASAANYAHSFAPATSIFVQLQDTPASWGATRVCPGTHKCTEGDTYDLCEEHGFQAVDDDTGVWGAGDVVMMNTAAMHAGAAHVDPNGQDRVMILMSLIPKPKPAAESRQCAYGINFFFKWDHYGFTWSDLAEASTVMVRPWTFLRSMGIFKQRANYAWGIDYITGGLFRVVTGANGLDPGDLVLYRNHGGIPFLPNFLQGDVVDIDDDFAWYAFLVSSFHKVMKFVNIVAVFGAILYVVSLLSWGLVYPKKDHRRSHLLGSTYQLALLCSSVYLLFGMAKRYVDSTQWAKDSKAGRLYSSVFENELKYGAKIDGITTLPNRHDVLIANRMAERHLNMYNDFIDHHDGNHLFLNLVRGVAPTYDGYSATFQEATAKYIVDLIGLEHHGRFLEQGFRGNWYIPETKDVLRYTKRVLASESSPTRGALLKELSYLISDLRYGVLRDSALAIKHAVPYLRHLDKRLCGDGHTKSTPGVAPGKQAKPATRRFEPSGVLSKNFQLEMGHAKLQRNPSAAVMLEEPFFGAWISAKSFVEALVDDHWVPGFVLHVTAHGNYHVEVAPDSSIEILDGDEIRPFLAYEPDEDVQVLLTVDDDDNDDTDSGDEDYEYFDCEIVERQSNGAFLVQLSDSEENVHVEGISRFRRFSD